MSALLDALEATEGHLLQLGFDCHQLIGATGFPKIRGLRDAVNVIRTTDESRRRFEILAREVFSRFKALVMEPSAHAYAERHDNLEAIYKKLQERRDLSDVTDVLKQLHRIVNVSIATEGPGEDQQEELRFDLSTMDMEKLRDEFAKRGKRKATAIHDIRQLVEAKLRAMIASNPLRMDYYGRYSEIVAAYNREKDRVTMEETFAQLTGVLATLDAEGRRAAEEGLSEDELAIFDLLKKSKLTQPEREMVKGASKSLLARLVEIIGPLEQWTEKETTRAEVETEIIDDVFRLLPSPPFGDDEKEALAEKVFRHVWAQTDAGRFPSTAA